LFGTALVTVGGLLVGHVRPTIPALLLLVPISVAGVLGGALVGVVVAVVAALAYALAFLPPIGHLRIGLTEDVFVLATFVVVAVLVAFISDARRTRSSTRPLDDQRAALLRGVSHDLRSPLTTIKSVSTDLLDGPDYDAATRAELLNMVVDESDRLDRIVGNLLSVSRIDAGALVPERSACDIGEIVATCARRFERLGGNAAGVEVVVQSDLPEVDVDAVQVDQVLTNLVENARRAAPPESSISVRAWRHSDAFVGVSVDDDGPGFDSIDHGDAFEPFRSTTGSSGLGLAVCKAIVEAHGGTITVGRSSDGGGAVTFTLPTATGQSCER
jgi:two-component system, OmpR family, sensor histidine kinase KdpD